MSPYLQTIIAIGVVAMSAGTFVAQFRKGNRSESGEIIEFYKKQAADYKDILETTRKEYIAKHEDLLAQVGVLRGELNTERKLREQYELILKDKNPETEAFMKLLIKAVEDQNKVNKEVVTILKEIHIMATQEHDRDLKITSTVTKK